MSDYPPPPPPPPPPPGQPQWGQPAPPPWAPPGQQWVPPGQQWPAQGFSLGGTRFAGFWARFGAVFIDGLILSPFGIAGRIVLSTGKHEIRACGFDNASRCSVPAGSTWALWALITVVGFVVGLVYYGFLEGRTGQTIGKRALGVKVLDARTGTPIGVGRAIGRHFAKFLSGIPCGLGYLWMLWDPAKQTWHDKIVGSYVVTA